MSKMTVIQLLNKIANGEEVPKKIKYINLIWEYDEDIKEYIHDNLYLIYSMNSKALIEREVEIIEENKKELHANDIEFNINNDKKDCIITLDENDLGIDKLHLDNCYFYKENDKWYVKKCDFKSFKLGEEHKIPDKIEMVGCNMKVNILDKKTLLPTENMQTEFLIKKINEILDYLEGIK